MKQQERAKRLNGVLVDVLNPHGSDETTVCFPINDAPRGFLTHTVQMKHALSLPSVFYISRFLTHTVQMKLVKAKLFKAKEFDVVLNPHGSDETVRTKDFGKLDFMCS